MDETMIRVAIADDDAGMRLVMRKLIERQEGYELAGEYDSGQALLDAFDTIDPDLCVLDVEMPGMTGIECAREIQDTNPMTVLIFATAHDQYMGDAFSLYAFDYLLKPFKVDRVKQTLAKARERILAVRQASSIVLPAEPPRPPHVSRIMLRSEEGLTFLSSDDIVLVQREERTTVVYARGGSRYVTTDTLSDMEEKLSSDKFFRCHKSYIINLDCIGSITPYGRWTWIIKLKGIEQDALITHEKFEELKKLFR